MEATDDEDEAALEAQRATLRRRWRPPIGTPWPRRRTPLRGCSSIPSSRRWHELRNPKGPGRSDPYAAAVASFRDATVFALPRHLPFSSAGQQLSIVDHAHDETADVYRAGGKDKTSSLCMRG